MTNNKKKLVKHSSGLSEFLFKGYLDNLVKGSRKYGNVGMSIVGNYHSGNNEGKVPAPDMVWDSGSYAKIGGNEGMEDEKLKYAMGDVGAVQELYKVQRIANLLSKMEEGNDFEVSVAEIPYLRGALQKTDKRIMVIGDCLDEDVEDLQEAEVVSVSHKRLMAALRESVEIIVASVHDKASTKCEDGILYIWIKE
ncbi:hypothetical protein [Bacillus mycoides]|uniref:hypothetical protein n=1 Tax=Bacillus mycoides TaxID=1405 RepID=UPI003A7F6F29